MSAPTTLVNGYYPLSYFSLTGTDSIEYPDSFWWSSRQRFAAVDAADSYLKVAEGGEQASEYLEIDLGRIRQLNYINFDVLKAPIDITIEYDINSNANHEQVWVPVKRLDNVPFESKIIFDANSRVAWQNADFHFTDPRGDIVHTRFVRLTFTRRDEAWPLSDSQPFPWPVFVKHLRLGRFISTLEDVVGPLVAQDSAGATALALAATGDVTRQVRQQFVYPANAQRGDNLIPRIMGFGVYVEVDSLGADETSFDISTDVAFDWSLWDVTGSPVLLREGTHMGAIVSGRSWIDVYLPETQLVAGSLTSIYELRVLSRTPSTLSTVWTVSPNSLSFRTVPGTLTFTNGSTAVTSSVDTRGTVHVGDYLVNTAFPDQAFTVNAVTNTTITINSPYTNPTASGAAGALVYPLSTYSGGSYVEDPSKNLVMRVWADVADEGQDVLGNAFRYGVRIQQAANVLDSDKAGWMSQPVPTPDAVEALYFDVRQLNGDGLYQFSQIDAIRIAPRTPGVRMNIYYSRQNLQGEVPADTADWDYLLWSPASQQSYVLRRDEIIELPHSLNTAYIKLEFTALNPLPYYLPRFPPLPPRQYRRFPTWVEDQFNNALVRRTVNDWFVRSATPVQIQILEALADPILEFQYEQKLFLAALALGQVTDQQTVNSQLVDTTNRTFIDPVTASKIYINDGTLYQNDLTLSVDQNSILGKTIAQRTLSASFSTAPTEAAFTPDPTDTIPVVSTVNDRVSEAYQTLARVPMRFNRTCRHEYVVEEGEFNKKAYFVGIDSVRFLRTDYTVQRDDPIFFEDFYNDDMLEENTWEAEPSTTIPDGATVYVSYSVNPDVIDEPIVLGGTAMVPLSITGAPARDILVYSSPNKQGTQFFQHTDYELAYDSQNGQRATLIGRSALSSRLVAPLQDINYVDANIVIAHAIIPSAPTLDVAVVIGAGAVSAVDAPLVPTYGLGVYGGTSGTYGALAAIIADAATSVAVGHPSSTSNVISTDSNTVSGVAHPTSTDTLN